MDKRNLKQFFFVLLTESINQFIPRWIIMVKKWNVWNGILSGFGTD